LRIKYAVYPEILRGQLKICRQGIKDPSTFAASGWSSHKGFWLHLKVPVSCNLRVLAVGIGFVYSRGMLQSVRLTTTRCVLTVLLLTSFTALSGKAHTGRLLPASTAYP